MESNKKNYKNPKMIVVNLAQELMDGNITSLPGGDAAKPSKEFDNNSIFEVTED